MSEENKELEKAELKDQAMGVGSALAKTGLVVSGATAGAMVGGTTGAIIGAAAGLGAELINVVIPNFKQQRYDKLIEKLEGRIALLEGEAKQRAEGRVHSPEFADLFEDGARQASRALSDERIQRIVHVLENSLTDEEMQHLQRKRVLELFGQLNDVEVLLLQSEALYPDEARVFWQQHPELIGPHAHLGSSQEDVDRSILHESYREHLNDLGLVRRSYQKPSFDKPVEFDFKTGQIKAFGYEVTGLGRLLLHEVGMREPLHQGRDRDGNPRSARG